MRSACLHVLADVSSSVLAVFALLAGKYFGACWMDPMMGIICAVLVTCWSWGLLTATGSVLLDRQAPDEIYAKIRKAIEADGDARITDFARMVDRSRYTCSYHLGSGA